MMNVGDANDVEPERVEPSIKWPESDEGWRLYLISALTEPETTWDVFGYLYDEWCRWAREHEDPTPCIDCQFDVSTLTPGPGERYMVTDEIWKLAVPDDPFDPNAEEDKWVLCIGCLEDRIGRRLKSTDFTDAPINDPKPGYHSERLLSRLV